MSEKPTASSLEKVEAILKRYEQKLWMRDLVMGAAYPPVER